MCKCTGHVTLSISFDVVCADINRWSVVPVEFHRKLANAQTMEIRPLLIPLSGMGMRLGPNWFESAYTIHAYILITPCTDWQTFFF